MIQRMSMLRPPWRLRYLNDDGSELKEESELCRGRGVLTVRWSQVAINASTWDQVYSLP